MKKKYTVTILLTALISGILTGCGNTASGNEPKSVSFEELIHVRATSIEQEENADLYENVEQLIRARGDVLFELVSGGEFNIQNDVVQGPHIMVTKEGENGEWEEPYILVTLEGVDSLEDLWQYAQTVYSEEYVMDVIASTYEHLYVEQDGHLYKAIADAPGFGFLWDEIKIWKYCSRLFVLVPLESDDPESTDYCLLSLRENEEKPYSYEIVEEIFLSPAQKTHTSES